MREVSRRRRPFRPRSLDLEPRSAVSSLLPGVMAGPDSSQIAADGITPSAADKAISSSGPDLAKSVAKVKAVPSQETRPLISTAGGQASGSVSAPTVVSPSTTKPLVEENLLDTSAPPSSAPAPLPQPAPQPGSASLAGSVSRPATVGAAAGNYSPPSPSTPAAPPPQNSPVAPSAATNYVGYMPEGPSSQQTRAGVGAVAGGGSSSNSEPGIRPMTLAPSKAPATSPQRLGGRGVSPDGSGGGSSVGSALAAGWGSGYYPGGWTIGNSSGGGTGFSSAAGSGSASVSSPDRIYDQGAYDISAYASGGADFNNGSGYSEIGALGGVGVLVGGTVAVSSIKYTVPDAIASQTYSNASGITNTAWGPTTVNYPSPGLLPGSRDGVQWYWGGNTGIQTATLLVTFVGGSQVTLQVNYRIQAPAIVDISPGVPFISSTQQPVSVVGTSNSIRMTETTASKPGQYAQAEVTTTTLRSNLQPGDFSWILVANLTNDVISTSTGGPYTIGDKSAGIPMLDTLASLQGTSGVIAPDKTGYLPQDDDGFQTSPMAVYDNPGFEISPTFVNNYVSGSGTYVTKVQINDKYTEDLMYHQATDGLEFAIGYVTWSEIGTMTFNGGQTGAHTASYYTNPANWTDSSFSPTIAQTVYGVASITEPTWVGYTTVSNYTITG